MSRKRDGDQSRRGRGRAGIGRRLLELAMEKAAEAGCYKLVLSSNSRRTDAHRFYENLGFERHGISFAVAIRPADQ
ncbi:MAG TPA: GNAT family N-acetyltransferase [Thermoanaerobaculia bacterium]|nr:GNAT family N-acetyltransferase [Thermoanaerobaculia bacterium]